MMHALQGGGNASHRLHEAFMLSCFRPPLIDAQEDPRTGLEGSSCEILLELNRDFVSQRISV